MTANRQSGVSVSVVHGHVWGSFTEDKDSVTSKFCSRFFEQSTTSLTPLVKSVSAETVCRSTDADGAMGECGVQVDSRC